MRVRFLIVAAIAALLLATGCSDGAGSEMTASRPPTSPPPTGVAADGGAATPTPHDTPAPTPSATPTPTGTPGPAEDVAVAVDADGRLVVLDATTGEEIRELLDGVDVHDPASNDIAVSPDSGEVVVALPPNDASGNSELVVVPVAGGEPQVVARGSAPAFSPDGDTLAYVSFENDTGTPEPVLVLLDRDSGERTRLTREQPFTFIPDVAWTSDGKGIVFTAGEIRTGLYAVSRDAASLDAARRLGPELDGAADETSWGPVAAFGSDRLAVVETCCGVPGDDRWRVLAVDADDGTTHGDLLPDERVEATHLDNDAEAARLLIVVRGGPGGGPLLRWDGEGDAEQIADRVIVASW